MLEARDRGLPELLTVDEVAETLRANRKVVHMKIARGQIPGVTRIGRRVLALRDHLSAWISRCEEVSPWTSAADQV